MHAPGPDASRRILLINPNSSAATTDMMVAIARRSATAAYDVVGVTACRAPGMIVTGKELAAAADEVVELGLEGAPLYAGMIVSAFGDPGLAALRSRSSIPVVGLCEASMREAARGGRRFGVATTTPDLVDEIAHQARTLGLEAQFTGTRCTPGDPWAVITDADLLRAELADAVRACRDRDGAEAVIIGGGPLGQAAAELQPMCPVPIVAPIPSALARLRGLMAHRR